MLCPERIYFRHILEVSRNMDTKELTKTKVRDLIFPLESQLLLTNTPMMAGNRRKDIAKASNVYGVLYIDILPASSLVPRPRSTCWLFYGWGY